ncbi:hypothetical protein [Thermoproteus tenax]|uniref:Na+/proline symporter n=1 Tax=Thermoproteus tenax (strain ATCC 35583 / DSM 2078 / JCM 9277 / NBRC 100435 / Kra 1) TaxID=768679 RepID=G4RPK6_THETK|nr:hypothetical protein [Thermoproteus tenax]CCC81501.1 Na+/proline symporter [Thermoproteus tenax Kra 1]
MYGQISIEQAILLAIVIIIAVAFSWYMYTTFLSYTQSGTRVAVSEARLNASGYLTLIVSNLGPSPTAEIISVYIDNVPCFPYSSSGQASINGNRVIVKMGAMAVLVYRCPGVVGAPGTTVQGSLVVSTGAAYPFTAVVS